MVTGWRGPLVNNIEIAAERAGYFSEFLPHYPSLKRRTEREASGKDGEGMRRFWSTSGKLLYDIFETLHYIAIMKSSEALNTHLPTFVAVHNTGYLATEYLSALVSCHTSNVG
jgi:hypothetical protein